MSVSCVGLGIISGARASPPLRPDQARPELDGAGDWCGTRSACSASGSTTCATRSPRTCSRPGSPSTLSKSSRGRSPRQCWSTTRTSGSRRKVRCWRRWKYGGRRERPRSLSPNGVTEDTCGGRHLCEFERTRLERSRPGRTNHGDGVAAGGVLRHAVLGHDIYLRTDAAQCNRHMVVCSRDACQ